MKVIIRNTSNKPRSEKAMADLKAYASFIAVELGIHKKIKEIRINYRKDWHGYYPKGRPLAGFNLLWNNGIVTINLAKYYDTDQDMRKDFIIHELVHVRQLISKDLVISKDERNIKWKGVVVNTWKKFRDKEFDKLSRKKGRVYVEKLMPWEREVELTCNKYERLR